MLAVFLAVRRALLGSTDRLLLDAAATALLAIDPLPFAGHYPAAAELAAHLLAVPHALPPGHGLLALLTARLDREVADMPRSLFLGTAAPPRPAAAQAVPPDALARAAARAADWPLAPYLFEPFVRLQLHRLATADVPADEAEALLGQLEGLPSLMQLHWSRRLVLLHPLADLVHSLLAHLTAAGRAPLPALEARLAAAAAASSSPSALAAALLLRTCVERARLLASSDPARAALWARQLAASQYDPRFAGSEEAATAVRLSLLLLQQAGAPTPPPPRLPPGTPWLALLDAHTGPRAPGPMPADVPAALQCSSPFDLAALLRPYAEQAALSPADTRQVQVLAALAAHGAPAAAIDLLREIHPRAVLAEPADAKGLIAVCISRAAAASSPDAAEAWARHLVGRLEKPAPAILKTDAAAALHQLLFEGGTPAAPFAPFFTTSLPALISATTDSRLASWFLLLLASYAGRPDPAGTPPAPASANRFGRETALGLCLAQLESARHPARAANVLLVLARLRQLPRLAWGPLLAPHPAAAVLPLALAHVAAPLATGGVFVSPPLLEWLKRSIPALDRPGLLALLGALPTAAAPLEAADQAQVATAILLHGRLREDAALLEAALLAISALPHASLDPQLVLASLHEPVDVSPALRRAYAIAATLVPAEDASAKGRLLRLCTAMDQPPPARTKLLLPLLREPGLHPELVRELVALSAAERSDLCIRILETLLIEPAESAVLLGLLQALLCQWAPSTAGRWPDTDAAALLLAWKDLRDTFGPDAVRRIGRLAIRLVTEGSAHGLLRTLLA